MLERSRKAAHARDDVDEDDDVDEIADDGRGGRLAYVPRLMVKAGDAVISSGDRSIM